MGCYTIVCNTNIPNNNYANICASETALSTSSKSPKYILRASRIRTAFFEAAFRHQPGRRDQQFIPAAAAGCPKRSDSVRTNPNSVQIWRSEQIAAAIRGTGSSPTSRVLRRLLPAVVADVRRRVRGGVRRPHPARRDRCECASGNWASTTLGHAVPVAVRPVHADGSRRHR